MDKQALFDKAVGGILKQRGFGYSVEHDRCAYETDDGCKCAIGQIVPDDLMPSVRHKNGGYFALVADIPELIKRWEAWEPGDDVFLNGLQTMHDGAALSYVSGGLSKEKALEQFRISAISFAEKYDLNTKVLDA